MRENFGTSLRLTLTHEGGWSDHPSDPGGATMKGITLATYRSFFRNNRLGKEDLRNISDETVARIYRDRYWSAVKGDDLPLGLDFAVFDYGVNSGPSRAIKALQRVVGVTADGAIGPQTMLAINGFGARQAIVSLCASRLTFLQGLKTWSVFGKGWGRRVAEVEDAALGMVGIRQPQPPTRRPEPSQPIPEPDPVEATRGDDKPEWLIVVFFRWLARLFKGPGR